MIDIDFYFLFTICAVLLYSINKTIGFFVSILFCSLFLLYLPTTGLDYDVYKDAYDNSYLIDTFPWFKSATLLTAEKGYIRYQGFFGVFLPYGFPSFLMLNFLINVFISWMIFKGFKSSIHLNHMWLYFLPVIFPTLYYFSPRSSISFFLCFFALILFSNKKHVLALFLIYLSMSIHTQYTLQVFLLIYIYICTYIYKQDLESFKKLVYVTSFVVFILTFFLSTFSNVFEFFIKLVPSSDYMLIKFKSYASNIRTGFRITSILSILVYPYLIFKLQEYFQNSDETLYYNDKAKDQLLINILFAIIFFGAAINLGFYNQPHMAGRLSRLSEYIGFGLILPSYLYTFFGVKGVYILIFFLILLSPILFGSIYTNAHWFS